MASTKKLLHLSRRAGFGSNINQLLDDKGLPDRESLLKDSRIFEPFEVITLPVSEFPNRKMTGDEKKEIRIKARQDVIRLNLTWMDRLSVPKAVLREKLSLLWHDHFACRIIDPYPAQQYANVLRKYALGKFGNLLMSVSQSPAMLSFLNNQQNRKDHPNENFAREVLELFTLGRGYYSEDDIKNAARAFTGWAFDRRTNEYVFRKRIHDDGIKTFRGKTGNFTGEDILRMVLEDKQTSRFIVQKIWNYFVSTEVNDEEITESLARNLYRSEYDLEKLMENIFSSGWFYDNRFVGKKIKTPVEFITGIILNTGGTFVNAESLIYLQNVLGQILFLPPNVGGWPAGKDWIDSSSLTLRMSLPSILLRNTENDFHAKDDGDVNNVNNAHIKPNKLAFQMDWEKLGPLIKNNSAHSLDKIEEFLLATPTTPENRKTVEAYTQQSNSDQEFLKRAFIGFMSLPEYQLC